MPQQKRKVKKRSEIQVLRGEIGVYMESIDDKFDIVIEGQKGLQQGIEEIRNDIKTINQRLDRLEGRIAAIELRLDKLEIKVEGVLREIREIKKELKELREQKADKVQLHTLETRVVKLERQVA